MQRMLAPIKAPARRAACIPFFRAKPPKISPEIRFIFGINEDVWTYYMKKKFFSWVNSQIIFPPFSHNVPFCWHNIT